MDQGLDTCESAYEGGKWNLDEKCAVCDALKRKNERDWCFEWLRHLKDFEKASKFHADRDRQVELMVDHTDNEVRHIRSRLAIMQTETPAWTIIEKIQQLAEIDAMKYALNQPMKCQYKSISTPCPLDARKLDTRKETEIWKDLKEKAENEKEASEVDSKGKKIKYEILKRSVSNHIFIMLDELYAKIGREEARLKKMKSQSAKKFEGCEWPRYSLEFVSSSDDSTKEVEVGHAKNWYRTLYKENDDNDADAGPSRLVGPVGERPLHVCALSAFRFEQVDFEGLGNYLSKGILDGMMRFIRTEPGAKESFVPYGKDYCAAVGKFLLQDKNHSWRELRPKHDSEERFPPFWKHLCTWKWAHLWDRMPLRKCYPSDAPHRFAETLVSAGIYEGETILFFLIAGKDKCAIDELLETEPCRCSTAWRPVEGLFFHPMHRRLLTSFSVVEGWNYYIQVRYRDINVESSSKRSYFGLSALAFAASQGDVAIFDQVFHKVEAVLLDEFRGDRLGKGQATDKKGPQFDRQDGVSVHLRKALLDAQDRYGNTLLHVAAWNNKIAMFDRLIQLGADATIHNRHGLTPFTLTARLGVWETFHHIWDSHLTKTLWTFGNLEGRSSNHTFFDWKGIKTFLSRTEVQSCVDILVDIYQIHSEEFKPIIDKITASEWSLPEQSETENYYSLRHKLCIVKKKAKNRLEAVKHKKLKSDIEGWLCETVPVKQVTVDNDTFDEHEEDADRISAIRMITIFRPKDWYERTKDIIEKEILKKWTDGYHLVHLAQGLLPYCLIILIFGFMWWKRELHVLEHNLWWATPEATAGLTSDKILLNPVTANISELIRLTNASLTGTLLFQNGHVPPEIFGVESLCGWQAIRDSTSGRLQAVLVSFGVYSLLRLAYTQRRIRPSDWDENEDMIISTDETINFFYLNLEVLLHIVMSGVYITIFVARVSAGDQCINHFVRIEKNTTAIAALFLFINLIVVCKPYKGLGLLVLTTYKFLVSKFFNFFVLYSALFAGFLLAIQTLHNANRVYLAWLDVSPSIVPQVKAVTNGEAYIVNENPAFAERLQETHTVMDGCAAKRWPIYATAQVLLEISFGDGLSGVMLESRQLDYQCAGFNPDPLTAYLLVFWVFLTNVLVLNLIIAVMNHTYDNEEEEVHSIWLLDLSYRIMRYERHFPELINRMQIRRTTYSFFRFKYWKQMFMDACLVVFCYPEFHLFGLFHALYVWVVSKFSRSREPASRLSKGIADGLIKEVLKRREDGALEAENAARVRAGVKTVEAGTRKLKRGCISTFKGHATGDKLMAMSMLPDVIGEVTNWGKLKILTSTQPGKSDTGDYFLRCDLLHTNSVADISQPKLVFPQQIMPLPLPVAEAAPGSSPLCNGGPVQASHSQEAEQQQPLGKEKIETFLLVISLICRLDLLLQDFRESCTEHSTRPTNQASTGTDAAKTHVDKANKAKNGQRDRGAKTEEERP